MQKSSRAAGFALPGISSSLYQWALGAVAFIVFVLLAAQLGVSSFYAGRVLPGVRVAGINVGGLNHSEVRSLLDKKAKSVRVNLTVGSIHYDITTPEVGITYDLEATIDQALLAGRDSAFAPLQLMHAKKATTLRLAYNVDQASEKAFVAKLVKESGRAPVNATVVINNGVPDVKTDQNGYALSASVVFRAINTQVSDITGPIILTPTSQPARIRLRNVEPAVLQTKQLLSTPISLSYQAKSFTPTTSQIGGWISFKESGPDDPPGLIPEVDEPAIMAYLQTLAKQIDVNPTTRKVNVENGVATEVQAGVDGLALNQAVMAAQISSALKSRQPFNAAALTGPVPFKTEYNNTVVLNFPKYIEINLNKQRMWAYQDGKVVNDSPVTSGATGAGFPTATGMFSILAKQTDRHLKGYAYGPRYNYDVFVHYWMPFYQGFGLHDASWRRGAFGGQDYYYNGSHGCVNLPDGTAAWLFNWADVGTPVWVHP